MSKVLIIRHLPMTLSFKDKEQLLKHFGAENVWETEKKRNYVFASFSTIDKAKESLLRLHQLEIAQRRLIVEYSLEKEPVTPYALAEESSVTTKHVKEFLKLLNAWSPSTNFYQPPPVHVKYKYPDINANTAINIIFNLFNHKPLYIQMLHLMNKMCLETPFETNEKSILFFKETFKEFFSDMFPKPTEIPQSEPESEISSDETVQEKPVMASLPKRRKHMLPATRIHPTAMLSMAAMSKPVKPSNVKQKNIFETVPVPETKKISLVVPQNALTKPIEDVQVVGEIGKFKMDIQPIQIEKPLSEPEQPIISRKELSRNKLSYREMGTYSVFKNYHPGQTSMRLYIKNLSKTVTEQDVKRIYKYYMKDLSEEEQIGFDVRVMQEGRMKGQAFVTFPSAKIAETALFETNGYMLKGKPMVVQFARVANNTSIE